MNASTKDADGIDGEDDEDGEAAATKSGGGFLEAPLIRTLVPDHSSPAWHLEIVMRVDLAGWLRHSELHLRSVAYQRYVISRASVQLSHPPLRPNARAGLVGFLALS